MEDTPAVAKVLQEVGLATQDAWKIWQDGFEYVESRRRPSGGDFETYIQEKIHLLQHQPEGKVKSRTGFLLDAIRKNYANAEFEQARRVQKSVVQAQKCKALEQEKERLEREHEERWATLCLQVVQEIPVFSILKFFQVDSTGMFRMTSSARYFKKGVGSSRPNWRWIMCFLERPKANTSCKAWVKRFSCS